MLLIILIAIVTSIFTTDYSPRKFSRKGIRYTRTNLNLRNEPNVESDIKKTFSSNTQIYICDSTNNGFIMVLNEDNTKSGWVSLKYLSTDPITYPSTNILTKHEAVIEKFDSFQTIKKTIYIRLQKRLTKNTLIEIANYLKEKNKAYDNLFILYYLPGMDVNSGAWATTHFTPDLSINIIGATDQEIIELNEIKMPSGEIIGKWYDASNGVEHISIIFLEEDSYKIKAKYKDGSENISNLIMLQQHGLSKFQRYENSTDYLLIEKDGNLGVYDEYGKYSIGIKMND